MATTSNQTLLGAVIGTAIFLGVIYLGARVISAGWNAGK